MGQECAWKAQPSRARRERLRPPVYRLTVLSAPTPEPRTTMTLRSPLKPEIFHILLALAEGERHGYGIIKDVEAATDGRIRLLASPLYRRLRRLLDQGLIEDTGAPPATEDSEDERRRYYRLTSPGRAVLAEEARRLTTIAADRRIRRLARMDPEGGHV